MVSLLNWQLLTVLASTITLKSSKLNINGKLISCLTELLKRNLEFSLNKTSWFHGAIYYAFVIT